MKRWNPKWFPKTPNYYYQGLVSGTRFQYTPVEEFINIEIVNRLDKVWWFVRRNVAPHNIMKIDSLSREYSDPREYLLHSSFQILKNFIEDEEPFGFIDFSTNELDRWVEKELKTLYHWWTVERPNREDAYSGDFHGKEYIEEEADYLGLIPTEDPDLFMGATLTKEYKAYLDACREEEDRQEREDNHMLQRLINIRCHLWT